MKSLIALFAALALMIAAPAFAQEIVTLPSGKKVKVIEKDDGAVLILPVDEAEEAPTDEEEVEDAESAEDWRDAIKRIRVKLPEGIEPDEQLPRVKIIPWGEGKEVPEDMRKSLEEMREQMEKFRKEANERFEKMRKELEEQLGKPVEDLENDPDAEVEEYTKEAADGSWKVHIKIIRKTSKSSSESTPDKPAEEPKKETERKQ